jgi:hypothetical protein
MVSSLRIQSRSIGQQVSADILSHHPEINYRLFGLAAEFIFFYLVNFKQQVHLVKPSFLRGCKDGWIHSWVHRFGN